MGLLQHMMIVRQGNHSLSEKDWPMIAKKGGFQNPYSHNPYQGSILGMQGF